MEVACFEGVFDPCEEGYPNSNDDEDDDLDNDCDGEVDEDYYDCVPTNNNFLDNTCDGVDDDCDRSFDEDYQLTNTTCGVGVCENTGSLYCFEGQVESNCRPGLRTGDDDDQDGLDNDCDGLVDEGL